MSDPWERLNITQDRYPDVKRAKLFDLSKDKSEQKPDRFASGEAIDSMIVLVDSKNRQINFYNLL